MNPACDDFVKSFNDNFGFLKTLPPVAKSTNNTCAEELECGRYEQDSVCLRAENALRRILENKSVLGKRKINEEELKFQKEAEEFFNSQPMLIESLREYLKSSQFNRESVENIYKVASKIKTDLPEGLGSLSIDEGAEGLDALMKSYAEIVKTYLAAVLTKIKKLEKKDFRNKKERENFIFLGKSFEFFPSKEKNFEDLLKIRTLYSEMEIKMKCVLNDLPVYLKEFSEWALGAVQGKNLEFVKECECVPEEIKEKIEEIRNLIRQGNSDFDLILKIYFLTDRVRPRFPQEVLNQLRERYLANLAEVETKRKVYNTVNLVENNSITNPLILKVSDHFSFPQESNWIVVNQYALQCPVDFPVSIKQLDTGHFDANAEGFVTLPISRGEENRLFYVVVIPAQERI